jgi:hypothetical protein
MSYQPKAILPPISGKKFFHAVADSTIIGDLIVHRGKFYFNGTVYVLDSLSGLLDGTLCGSVLPVSNRTVGVGLNYTAISGHFVCATTNLASVFCYDLANDGGSVAQTNIKLPFYVVERLLQWSGPLSCFLPFEGTTYIDDVSYRAWTYDADNHSVGDGENVSKTFTWTTFHNVSSFNENLHEVLIDWSLTLAEIKALNWLMPDGYNTTGGTTAYGYFFDKTIKMTTSGPLLFYKQGIKLNTGAVLEYQFFTEWNQRPANVGYLMGPDWFISGNYLARKVCINVGQPGSYMNIGSFFADYATPLIRSPRINRKYYTEINLASGQSNSIFYPGPETTRSLMAPKWWNYPWENGAPLADATPAPHKKMTTEDCAFFSTGLRGELVKFSTEIFYGGFWAGYIHQCFGMSCEQFNVLAGFVNSVTAVRQLHFTWFYGLFYDNGGSITPKVTEGGIGAFRPRDQFCEVSSSFPASFWTGIGIPVNTIDDLPSSFASMKSTNMTFVNGDKNDQGNTETVMDFYGLKLFHASAIPTSYFWIKISDVKSAAETLGFKFWYHHTIIPCNLSIETMTVSINGSGVDKLSPSAYPTTFASFKISSTGDWASPASLFTITSDTSTCDTYINVVDTANLQVTFQVTAESVRFFWTPYDDWWTYPNWGGIEPATCMFIVRTYGGSGGKAVKVPIPYVDYSGMLSLNVYGRVLARKKWGTEAFPRIPYTKSGTVEIDSLSAGENVITTALRAAQLHLVLNDSIAV